MIAGPFGHLLVERQSLSRVRDMIVSVCFRIDVHRASEIAVSKQSRTFFVAGNRLGSAVCFNFLFRAARARTALDFLLLALTLACNHDLVSARLVLLALVWCMTWELTRVSTKGFRPSARLYALVVVIFAFPALMTCFPTHVDAAFQLLAALLTTSNIDNTARLVRKQLFAA